MRCDSHIHIVGPAERYPQAPTRMYLAGVAPLDTLRQHGAARGISRFVIVQPNFYGTDNTLLLESLDILGDHGRGVAVLDPAVTPLATLADFARRGVRGLRVNLYSTRVGREVARLGDEFAAMANLASSMSWHVEVIATMNVLIESADVLAGAPAPVVIDHYGLYGHARPQSPEGRRLLDLLRSANIWLKLSAPYRIGGDALATRPDAEWLAALLASAADRCVWGSDWPHTPPIEQQKDGAAPLPYRDLAYTSVVEDFLATLGSAELADRIMRDNPARLYGFPDP
jgi:predicted TIM-barrel fold metal-dependent hydrolase